MRFGDCTQRIIKYLLFSILFLLYQCFAIDDTAETEEDGNYLDHEFFLYTTKKQFGWEDWTVGTQIPPLRYDDGGYSGGGDPTVFFVILGVGVIIFIALLFLCKKARDQMANFPPGTAMHSPIAGIGSTDVNISFIGAASNNLSPRRPGVSRQTSEKPPDYATVTLGDFNSEKSLFPSVLRQKSTETPPPKYDENNPMFK